MIAIASWLLALPPASVQAQSVCGRIGEGSVTTGPYDYRTDRKEVEFIEGNHFQPQVQALIGGVSGRIGDELNYLLTHVPNDHKALLVLMTYGEKLKWAPAPGLRYSYECYYERALRWRNDDAIAHMIYATYLNKFARTKEALEQLAYASKLPEATGFTQYNIGLIYLDMKQYELALAQAQKAQALGFERAELRDGLKAVGKWRESPQATTNAAASEPAASAVKP